MSTLPNKEFQAMVPLLRERDFYQAESQRPISWPEYNLAQIEEASSTLTFIRDVVDEATPLSLQGKVGRPLSDPKDLVKAILACEALGFTERGAQGWMRILGPFLGIQQHLDDRTIGDAYDKIEVVYLLKQIFERTKD